MHASANSATVAYFASRSTARPFVVARPDDAAARAVEILADPGMVVPDDALQRVHDDFAIDQHGDTITGPREGVQIVGDHHDRQPQLLRRYSTRSSKAAALIGSRPEVGSSRNSSTRVQRQRARQRGALDHAARELRRILGGGIVRQAHQAQLQPRRLSSVASSQAQVLEHRQLDVLRAPSATRTARRAGR